MTLRTLIVCMVMLSALGSEAQVPTELDDCVGSSSDFCSDSTAVLVDYSCGQLFNRYYGRIAWPPLRNVGPVTIAVKTSNAHATAFPLYVEVRGRIDAADADCRTDLGGHLILVAQGGTSCGGSWESIGPVDLRPYGVPLGWNYSLQCTFFETVPSDFFGAIWHTVGFACIKVTSHPLPVSSVSWASMKVLYRDTTE